MQTHISIVIGMKQYKFMYNSEDGGLERRQFYFILYLS